MGGRQDVYKKTVADAVDFLSKRTKDGTSGSAGVQLAQHDGDESGGTKIKCYNCGMEGFTTKNCPRCAIALMKSKKEKKEMKKKSKRASHMGAFQR